MFVDDENIFISDSNIIAIQNFKNKEFRHLAA